MRSQNIENNYSLYQSAVAELQPTHILLAEDDREMRRLLAAELRKDGYHVEEVASGSELLHRIGTHFMSKRGRTPDLIISDIRMPGFSGLEVLAGLREADWATPVILITAFGDDYTHEEARRLGAVGVFDKPFDMDDLRTVVLNHAHPSH